MRFAFVDDPNPYTNPLVPEFEKLGVEVVKHNQHPDIMWNASVDAFKYADMKWRGSGAKLVNYVWDLYGWAIERRRPDKYNWPGYIEFIAQSDLILVPNVGTQLRVKEYTGRDSTVVHTSVNYRDVDVPMEDYVLNPLREYPDPHWGWTKRACEELGIKYWWPDHSIPEEHWPNAVAGARLMVCEYEEASTGGLTLIEGLWNGVPSIVFDGPYSGGKEYLGPYAHTFSTYEELKEQIRVLYNTPQRLNARQFIRENYSVEVMAHKLVSLFGEMIHG